MERPETRYAVGGDGVHLAYQIAGSGATDVLVSSGFISHVEHQWEEPGYARSLERIASFGRLICYDKRGLGLSDPVPIEGVESIERRVDDIGVVMADGGSGRAALLTFSEACAASLLFAATYPERVTALVIFGGWARFFADRTYAPGVPRDFWEPILTGIREGWGSAAILPLVAPSVADDPRLRSWWAEWERLSASPGTAASQAAVAMELDLRNVLAHVTTPTLVLHRRDDPFIPFAHGRYLAEHIPNAKLVELPGLDHPHFVGDVDSVMIEIEDFLTGHRGVADDDRLLATVLFTDIVDSTTRAAELGDLRWRALLDTHHALVRRQLERFAGTEVDTAGDGFLATFDTPARAIRAATAIRDGVHSIGLTIRAGIHTGEVERSGAKFTGLTVHIGARLVGLAAPDEVLTTQTVRDLVVGSAFAFSDRGSHRLRGVPDKWRLYAVTDTVAPRPQPSAPNDS